MYETIGYWFIVWLAIGCLFALIAVVQRRIEVKRWIEGDDWLLLPACIILWPIVFYFFVQAIVRWGYGRTKNNK